MSKTIHDLKGLTIGDKIAIVINNDEATATITGTLSGIQGIGEKDIAGLTIKGIPNWIWIEDNMTVTWAKADN